MLHEQTLSEEKLVHARRIRSALVCLLIKFRMPSLYCTLNQSCNKSVEGLKSTTFDLFESKSVNYRDFSCPSL